MAMSKYCLPLDAGENAEMALAFALLGTPWPTDAELDSLLLEDCATEDAPVRNDDYLFATQMTPQELLSASRRLLRADFELQIEALQRLTRACEELRWPLYLGGQYFGTIR